ncbi:hypothetical protein D3C71_1507180 [compost metagenome]
MAHTKSVLDINYGRAIIANEVLPYSVRLSGCKNITELDEIIYGENMIASRFHVTVYDGLARPALISKPYADRYYEIRFASHQDAVRIKLMMRYEY